VLIDEAAELLVKDFTTIREARMSDFSQIISVLCYLYPAVPMGMVMHEVVRNFSRTVYRQAKA
jgi:hypothetical protein